MSYALFKESITAIRIVAILVQDYLPYHFNAESSSAISARTSKEMDIKPPPQTA
jgi:hypothetical protein